MGGYLNFTLLRICLLRRRLSIEGIGLGSLGSFGYANLNNAIFAEWGYISIDELVENGAELDRDWKPCTYRDATKRIEEKRIREGKRWENR